MTWDQLGFFSTVCGINELPQLGQGFDADPSSFGDATSGSAMFSIAYVAEPITAAAVLRMGVAELQVEIPERANVGVLLFRLVLADEAAGSNRATAQAFYALSSLQDWHAAIDGHH